MTYLFGNIMEFKNQILLHGIAYLILGIFGIIISFLMLTFFIRPQIPVYFLLFGFYILFIIVSVHEIVISQNPVSLAKRLAKRKQKDPNSEIGTGISMLILCSPSFLFLLWNIAYFFILSPVILLGIITIIFGIHGKKP